MGLINEAPDFHPKFTQVTCLSPQMERRGPLPHLLVKSVEVFLRPLCAGDQLQGLGAIFHFEREHLQAGLAPLEGVAALVHQRSHRFANGCQPPCLTGSFFGLLAGSDVAKRKQVKPGCETRDGPILHIHSCGIIAHERAFTYVLSWAKEIAASGRARLLACSNSEGFKMFSLERTGCETDLDASRRISSDNPAFIVENQQAIQCILKQRPISLLVTGNNLVEPRDFSPVLLPLQHAPDAGSQRIGVHRLKNVVSSAASQCSNGTLDVGVASHNDDGYLRCLLADARQDLLRCTIGQLAIQQDQQNVVPALTCEEFARRTGNLDLVTVQFQNVAQVEPRVFIVIDDDDLRKQIGT